MYNKIIRLKTVTSTNTYLKDLSKCNAEDGTVVISEKQSNGRGTHGRYFESPEGGLYLSYLKYINSSPEKTTDITQWTAVSVSDAIYDTCGIKCDIKYINDLMYNNKKLCGILTELSENRLIIGIGLNVNTDTTRYSESLSDIITSLYMISGHLFDINILSNNIIMAINNQFEDWPDNDWRINEYKKRLIDKDALEQFHKIK